MEKKIYEKCEILEMDEDLRKLVIAMLVAYPGYRRMKRFYKKEFNKDLSFDDIVYGKQTPPIETLPFGRALDKLFDIDPIFRGYPLFYELAEKAFSLEEEIYKTKE